MKTLKDILLAESNQLTINWPFLSRKTSSKHVSIFLIGSILNYQIPLEKAWLNAERLVNTILPKNSNPWLEISKYSEQDWADKFKEYHLHRFPVAHNKIWTVSNIINSKYNSDPRNIWNNDTPEQILERLAELKIGPQLSRMIIGALIDMKIIIGTGDIKPDIHIRRLMGRLINGKDIKMDAEEAVEEARKIYSVNPWKLDRALFFIAKDFCHNKKPNCKQCPLRNHCSFRNKL